MLRTKYKYEKYQRAITPKLYKSELWFLYTAPPLTKIYVPKMFQVDTSYSFLCYALDKIMADGWDRQVGRDGRIKSG